MFLTNYKKGVEYASQEKFKEAKGEFEKALRVDPHYGSARRALKVIDDVIEEKLKSKTAIHIFKGITCVLKRQSEVAINEFNKAIEINPEYAYTYTCRGYTLESDGQFEKALADYSKAIEINPKHVYAYNNRGLAYHDNGQYDQAIADYNKAIELNPKYAYAYNNSVKHYFLLDIIIHPYILLTS